MRPLGPKKAVRRSLRRVTASDPLWVSVALIAGAVEQDKVPMAITVEMTYTTPR